MILFKFFKQLIILYPCGIHNILHPNFKMSSNPTKRKRRRTRKCLDELRKRSRRLIFSNNSSEKVYENNQYLHNNVKEMNFHTSRLTLAMFPKAIQSETITRPLLAEMSKRLKVDLSDIVGNKTCESSEKSKNVKNKNKLRDLNLKEANEDSTTDNFFKQNAQYVTNTTNTFGSYVLLSPNNLETSQTDSDTPEGPETHHRIQDLYEDFLSDASSYMKANASEALLKDYNLKKVKQKLQELYIKNNIHITSTATLNQRNQLFQVEESLVQNPMDYIRQKCEKYQGLTAFSNNFSETSSLSVNSPQSPSAPLLSSPKSIHYETPEYIYFPHKLN